MGTTMDRLAEWEVATLTGVVEADPELPSRRDEALRLVETIGPDFEALLTYVWRRHLAAAVTRVESLTDAADEHVVTTVGFADLVGFSELTNDLAEDEIGDLVEVFESRSADVVSRHRGRIVKTLGDSVLFLANTPAEGIDIALGHRQGDRRRRAAAGRPGGVVTGPWCCGWATSTAPRSTSPPAWSAWPGATG